jgi:hypothetical protein
METREDVATTTAAADSVVSSLVMNDAVLLATNACVDRTQIFALSSLWWNESCSYFSSISRANDSTKPLP